VGMRSNGVYEVGFRSHSLEKEIASCCIAVCLGIYLGQVRL
jgi:hypothetical protein